MNCETCIHYNACKSWSGIANFNFIKYLKCEQFKDKNDVAEVKHGKWIENKEKSEKHIEKIYYCSACENYEAWGDTERTKFCPNCGAKMDGDKE